MKTELEELKERIKEIEEKQYNCDHEWGEIECEPYEKDITEERFVYQGSDSYYTRVATGQTYTSKRWTRICKKCGKKEVAYDYEDKEEIIEVKKKYRREYKFR